MTSRFNPHPTRRLGAICRTWWQHQLRCHGFNPHPTRRLGAICKTLSRLNLPQKFQSSPNPKVGCHDRICGKDFRSVRGFNPHPTRRLGAISYDGERSFQRVGFNPHPTRRLGAMRLTPNSGDGGGVSILTQPEGWVPFCRSGRMSMTPKQFQSSPNPKVGCHLSPLIRIIYNKLFQSSPNPKVGCHSPLMIIIYNQLIVSILTQPEGWVPCT